jgi:hypothetical protein
MLEWLRHEEGERRVHLDAVLGDLDLIHRVSLESLVVIAFLLYAIALKCRVGSATIGLGLACLAANVPCDF